jgi:hypothetical protein
VWDAHSNWNRILARYQVNAALLPVDSALATLLREQRDWKAVFEDQVAVLFEKTDKSKSGFVTTLGGCCGRNERGYERRESCPRQSKR